MRIFRFGGIEEVKKHLLEIGVDPYGIKIMLPKANAFLVRLSSVNNIAANILKQEMLAYGADAALARGSLTGQTKKTDVLLIGQAAQFKSLADKLKIQPFGLNKLGGQLETCIRNFNQENFTLSLCRGTLRLGPKPVIMGIINLTPDSFSQDGLYRQSSSDYPALALKKAQILVSQGARIIDLGGESSRPGARSISVKEELARTIPVVKLLAKKIKIPISIDTVKSQVAQAALESGAQIINDIGGLRDRQMVKIAARYKAAVVIMHMLGRPVNMQKKIAYASLIEEIIFYLKRAVELAETGGVGKDKIIIDPGIGFGKTTQQNLVIIKNLEAFKVLGKPILVGPSRKAFIGKILGETPGNRINGTIAACLAAVERKASILRVHDVKEINQALKINQVLKNAYA
jgi:dihydropteroate synthase